MDNYTATEQAYKNGYEQGQRDAVKHGRWFEMVESKEDGHTGEYYEEIYYNCLNCDYATGDKTPYCPNCGCKMDFGMNAVTYEERATTYKAALRKFGAEAQAIVTIEELSELQKEICKRFRGADNLGAIAEEIADVTIMLEQLRLILDINDKVCREMDYKVRRLQKKLGMEDVT